MLSRAILSSTLVGTSFAQKSPTNTFSGPPPPGNGIAIAQQSKDVLTRLSVGKDRAMYVTFKMVLENGAFFSHRPDAQLAISTFSVDALCIHKGSSVENPLVKWEV